MFSLLFVLGSVFAGVGAVKSVGSALVTAATFTAVKESVRLKRFMRLGINSEFEKDLDEGFNLFQFEDGYLSQEWSHLQKQKWVLTGAEVFQLLSRVRGQVGDEVGIDKLVWLSNNRMADEDIKKILDENG